MPGWEYLVLVPGHDKNRATKKYDWYQPLQGGPTLWGMEEILDHFGKKGWELVAAGAVTFPQPMMTGPAFWRYVFKRALA